MFKYIRNLFIIILLFAQIAGAAVPSTAVWEIRSSATAGNVNSGAFDSSKSGIDYSQQDAAQFSFTDLASTNGTSNPCTVTSASHNFVAADEGNSIFISAGTNWTVGRYFIASTAANAATLDRACGTAASISGGTWKEGGGLSLGSADDAIFETFVSGNMVWIKLGTYTIGGTVTVGTGLGTATSPIVFKGYQTTRGDNPSGTNRPLFDAGTVIFTWGAFSDVYYLRGTGTGTTVFTTGASSKFLYGKVTNTSTTTNRRAYNMTGNALLYNSEAISYRGTGVIIAGAQTLIYGNYIHDSAIGIEGGNVNSAPSILYNVIEGNTTAAISVTTASTGNFIVSNNTLYGAENKLGIGLSIVTASSNFKFLNNIVYGFTTGVNHADSQTQGFDDNNLFNNNTTNATNWTLGSNSLTGTAPGFGNATQLTGATATTSGSVLTQAGADFTASGVSAGRDYIYLVSGTGITAGVYGITAVGTTTLTLDIAPGTNATADKVWQINLGHNFAVGLGPRNKGYPGVFPASLSTGYLNIGAVQSMPGLPRRAR